MLLERLILFHRLTTFHPVAALCLYLLLAGTCVAVLALVASARGRSAAWSLFGAWMLPGLLIGLLVLMALPSEAQERPASHA